MQYEKVAARVIAKDSGNWFQISGLPTEFIRILIYNPLSGRHVFEVHHIPFSRSNLCQVPTVQINHQASTVLLCISTVYYIHEIDARFQNGIVSSRRELKPIRSLYV